MEKHRFGGEVTYPSPVASKWRKNLPEPQLLAEVKAHICPQVTRVGLRSYLPPGGLEVGEVVRGTKRGPLSADGTGRGHAFERGA